MDTIFMNSEKSKTPSKPHVLILKLSDEFNMEE